jgi:hypothetical protein
MWMVGVSCIVPTLLLGLYDEVVLCSIKHPADVPEAEQICMDMIPAAVGLIQPPADLHTQSKR